jgi:hypothetical protein
MDRGIWATWYDLEEKDREPFRDWLHSNYLPALERSGKYVWVANYIKQDAPLEVPTPDNKPHVGYTDDPIGQATENAMLIGASSPHVFFNPQILDTDQEDLDPKGMLKLRKNMRHAIMVEEERVTGSAQGAANHPPYPGPTIQFGSYRMKDYNNDFEAGRWYSQSRLPLMGSAPECVRARKMMVCGGWAKHAIIYEFTSLAARNQMWARVHQIRLSGDKLRGWSLGPRTLHTPGSPLIGNRSYPPVKDA